MAKIPKMAQTKKMTKPLVKTEPKMVSLDGKAIKLSNGNEIGLYKLEEGYLMVFQNHKYKVETKIQISLVASQALLTLLWETLISVDARNFINGTRIEVYVPQQLNKDF